jgi:hypothetical protein
MAETYSSTVGNRESLKQTAELLLSSRQQNYWQQTSHP